MAPLIALTLPSGVIVQYEIPSPMECMKARALWARSGGESSGSTVFHAYTAIGLRMVGSNKYDLEREDLWQPFYDIVSEKDLSTLVSGMQILLSTSQEDVEKLLKSIKRLDVSEQPEEASTVE